MLYYIGRWVQYHVIYNGIISCDLYNVNNTCIVVKHYQHLW